MSVLDASNAIQDRFRVQWGATTPYQLPNVDFDPPEPDPASPSTSAWARLTINDGDAEQPYLASLKDRQLGIVTVQVFVPVGINEGLAKTLAIQAAAIFRRVTVGALTFRTPTVRTVGRIPEDGPWHQVNAICPYWREE